MDGELPDLCGYLAVYLDFAIFDQTANYWSLCEPQLVDVLDLVGRGGGLGT